MKVCGECGSLIEPKTKDCVQGKYHCWHRLDNAGIVDEEEERHAGYTNLHLKNPVSVCCHCGQYREEITRNRGATIPL